MPRSGEEPVAGCGSGLGHVLERGYESTTTAEIAARAGVTDALLSALSGQAKVVRREASSEALIAPRRQRRPS